MASPLDYMMGAHQEMTQSGIGGFIRNKLAVARQAGLVSHQAKAYGDQNTRSAQASAQAKWDLEAPMRDYNKSVLDAHKGDIQFIEGRPVSSKLGVAGGYVYPYETAGSDEQYMSSIVRQMFPGAGAGAGGGGSMPPQVVGEGELTPEQIAAVTAALRDRRRAEQDAATIQPR